MPYPIFKQSAVDGEILLLGSEKAKQLVKAKNEDLSRQKSQMDIEMDSFEDYKEELNEIEDDLEPETEKKFVRRQWIPKQIKS